MLLVLVGDVWLFFCYDFTDSDLADIVSILCNRTWFVNGTWCKLGFFCIGARNMIGSCEESIHPLSQSIFGWVAANQE